MTHASPVIVLKDAILNSIKPDLRAHIEECASAHLLECDGFYLEYLPPKVWFVNAQAQHPEQFHDANAFGMSALLLWTTARTKLLEIDWLPNGQALTWSFVRGDWEETFLRPLEPGASIDWTVSSAAYPDDVGGDDEK